MDRNFPEGRSDFFGRPGGAYFTRPGSGGPLGLFDDDEFASDLSMWTGRRLANFDAAKRAAKARETSEDTGLGLEL